MKFEVSRRTDYAVRGEGMRTDDQELNSLVCKGAQYVLMIPAQQQVFL